MFYHYFNSTYHVREFFNMYVNVTKLLYNNETYRLEKQYIFNIIYLMHIEDYYQ